MSDYAPDLWIMAKMTHDKETIYKVFGSWYGGWAGSDSWKLSSGVTKIIEHENHYEVHNVSGSIYDCGKQNIGMSGYASGVWKNFLRKQEDGKYKLEEIDIKDVQLPVVFEWDQWRPSKDIT